MGCEYCGATIGKHDSRCPNADTPTFNHRCALCKEGIYNGEEYIVNDDAKYAHWECVDNAKDLAKFLGYEIKEMEDEDYY